MVRVEQPVLALLLFILCALLAFDLLLFPTKWTRRIGRLVLWSRRQSPFRRTFGMEYFERMAHKAVDEPQSVRLYQIPITVTGLVSLLLSLCILWGLLSFLLTR